MRINLGLQQVFFCVKMPPAFIVKTSFIFRHMYARTHTNNEKFKDTNEKNVKNAWSTCHKRERTFLGNYFTFGYNKLIAKKGDSIANKNVHFSHILFKGGYRLASNLRHEE